MLKILTVICQCGHIPGPFVMWSERGNSWTPGPQGKLLARGLLTALLSLETQHSNTHTWGHSGGMWNTTAVSHCYLIASILQTWVCVCVCVSVSMCLLVLNSFLRVWLFYYYTSTILHSISFLFYGYCKSWKEPSIDVCLSCGTWFILQTQRHFSFYTSLYPPAGPNTTQH